MYTHIHLYIHMYIPMCMYIYTCVYMSCIDNSCQELNQHINTQYLR